MYYYKHVLPRRVAQWFRTEWTRARITYNMDQKGDK